MNQARPAYVRGPVKGLLSVCAGLLLSTAQAQTTPTWQVTQPQHHFRAAAQLLKNNFFRTYAQLDEGTLEQPPTSQAQTLLALKGFSPRTSFGIQWSAQALDAERVRLCLKVPASRDDSWRALIQQGLRLGWTPANDTCEAQGAQTPEAWPKLQAFTLTLDRRDVPAASRAPEYPAMSGFDATAVTRAGLELTKVSGTDSDFVTITVTNPFVQIEEGPPPVGLKLQLTQLTVREGFVAQHTCEEILPDASCTIQVRYAGQHGNLHVGSLEGAFSNGARFRVGLLGKTGS